MKTKKVSSKPMKSKGNPWYKGSSRKKGSVMHNKRRVGTAATGHLYLAIKRGKRFSGTEASSLGKLKTRTPGLMPEGALRFSNERN